MSFIADTSQRKFVLKRQAAVDSFLSFSTISIHRPATGALIVAKSKPFRISETRKLNYQFRQLQKPAVSLLLGSSQL